MKRVALAGASLLFVTTAIYFATTDLPSAANVQLEFRVVHGPDDFVVPTLNKLSQVIADRSESRIQLHVNNQTGVDSLTSTQQAQVLQGLASGKFAMTQVLTEAVGKIYPEVNALAIPTVYRNHQHAAAVLDGEIGQRVLAKINQDPQGKFIAFGFTYCGGHTILATKSKLINSMMDLKALHIFASSSMNRFLFESIGASNEDGDVLTELDHLSDRRDDGRIVAIQYSYPRLMFANSKPMHRVGVVNQVHTSIQTTMVLMNREIYLSLPAEVQAQLSQSLREFIIAERTAAIALEEQLTKSERSTPRIHRPATQFRAEMSAQARRLDWSQFGVTPDMIREIDLVDEGVPAGQVAKFD